MIVAEIHEYGDSSGGHIATLPVVGVDADGEVLTLPSYLASARKLLEVDQWESPLRLDLTDSTRAVRVRDFVDAYAKRNPNRVVECYLIDEPRS